MSLNALYAVIDRFYIGQGCGEAAMAGLTLTFPVMMLFGAFGVFVGAGHAAVLSIKLGENDLVSCEKLVGELIALKLLLFFVLPPLVYFNIDTILSGGLRRGAGLLEDRRLLPCLLALGVRALRAHARGRGRGQVDDVPRGGLRRQSDS